MTHNPVIDPTIVRTERGLTIAGTRTTLYAVLDYVHAEWPPHLIREWLNLTEEQMAAVLAYLDDHRDEVEQEYALVVQQAEQNRRYWEEQNRQQWIARPPVALTPEQAALRERFETWRKQRKQV